jgi:hypothetical protein
MSATDEEEERARAWLRAKGYEPFRPTKLASDHPARLEPEQDNPDFWAEGPTLSPPHLWVEVKSIDPDDFDKAMDKFRDLIRAAEEDIPPGLHGDAIMEFDPNAIDQSVRSVLKSFARRSAKFVGQKKSLIFIQQTRNCDKEYQVEIDADTPIVVWARANELPLSSGSWFGDDIVFATAVVRMPDGSEITGPAHKFFQYRRQTECVLEVRLDPQDRMLDGILYRSGGPGQMRERTVRALEKANRQIKTACATLSVPGVVILMPRGSFGDNDQSMQAAMYGQFQVSFNLGGDHVEDAGVYHGPNGVFRHNKNTHISAAVHVRRQGAATFFPNPFARHPISEHAPLFAELVRANVKFV